MITIDPFCDFFNNRNRLSRSINHKGDGFSRIFSAFSFLIMAAKAACLLSIVL